MYRQKNTVGNLENVGFSVEGHEGIYNVLMMEEVQTIFAAGAGAVSKLVDLRGGEKNVRIKRIFNPKYPYEYLDRLTVGKNGSERTENRFIDEARAFFAEQNN